MQALTAHAAAHREPLPLPAGDPAQGLERARSLRRMKLVALAFLLAAAAVYFACRWAETQGAGAWIGYVRAASEAGMVGALADWFAVTALFRRPLGLPIPHTAIVRAKKDQVGRSLSGFVGDNFLDPELVTQKVHSAQIPRRVGTWLGGEGNAERVGAEVGRFVARVVAAIDENEAVAIVDRMVVARLAEPAWGPPLSRVLVPFLDEGRDEPLLQQLADFAHTRALESFDVIERAVGERAPTWAPDFVNELVGERVYRELVDTTWAIRSDPRHPVRLAIRRRLREFAEGLEHDPELIAKIEDLKRDLLDGERVPAISRNLWRAVRIGLIDATADPGSVLRVKIVEFVEGYGERLREDSALRAQVDRRIGDAAAFVARNYAGEITSIISETVERWDADEAGRKIELMVGRDLQFIRINGTVVGALAGLGIYSISTLLFGH